MLMSFGYTLCKIQRIFLRQGIAGWLIGCGIGALQDWPSAWRKQKPGGLCSLPEPNRLLSVPIRFSIIAVDVTLGCGRAPWCFACWQAGIPARRAASLIPQPGLNGTNSAHGNAPLPAATGFFAPDHRQLYAGYDAASWFA